MICLFDIDGTIASDAHRRHLLPSGSSYHCLAGATDEQIARYMDPALVARDAPIEDARPWLQWHRKRGDILHAITARTESLREVTTLWLCDKIGFGPEQLVMRKDSDRRSSIEVKVEMLSRFPRGRLYDDDHELVLVARGIGWEAFHAPGCFADRPEIAWHGDGPRAQTKRRPRQSERPR